jgi:EAL domain-containing protein (putative c-di-GMP-specific phosphodiesterase class I)/ActR/RegA family two-component response regulator
MTDQILIVDDEADLLGAYAEMLREAGYAVETAGSGARAMELFDRSPFDAVLTDIQMPGCDGVQLLQWVRERDLDVPVLIMTGNPRVETAVQALEYGALRYLLKPVRQAALIEAVAGAVRLYRMACLKREALTYLGAHDKLLGDRAGLEAAFSRALGGLWMAYQPIVRAADGSLFSHEALVRTVEQTLREPSTLLDAAERLGRVHDLGRAVRAKVAGSMAAGGGRDVFVNLHALDLTDEALFAGDSPLASKAKSVVLEITERASLDRITDLRQRVGSLRAMGYRIAIDDLGAGYAGLTTLAAVEPEIVKLDMALVRGVDHDPVKRRLIRSMTALCKELPSLVVAEGVETSSERDVLVELGCDLLQGFLFGKPGEMLHRVADARAVGSRGSGPGRHATLVAS